MLKEEWVKLMVTFSWEAGNVIDSGEVAVSFHPVSTEGGDTFATEGAAMERYVESPAYTVIEVSPCQTTLLFPFVTNQAGFDTGIAISNTSMQAGSCTISYHGVAAPDDWDSDEIAAERQEIFLLSATAMGFQGYIMADCSFQDGHGFGFVSNGYPTGPSTLAQGYLAVVME